jgi:hypothetical protein
MALRRPRRIGVERLVRDQRIGRATACAAQADKAGLKSYRAMRPLVPDAKRHRTMRTAMTRGTRLDTEIVAERYSNRWLVHRSLVMPGLQKDREVAPA